ncbi:MAG TPA: beta-ketoacyl-ACP synthase III [Pseudonocardiaceae bacterium]|jgi:3-oxoacyl-[acyl-carrier-protein] synthase-3|nr:beta-ketoacyl-ACP synthase III [Pseudonocardiaceae bacterium]
MTADHVSSRKSEPKPTRTAVIDGIGAWLPDLSVFNADLDPALNTSDEWIRSRTGIAHRYQVSRGTATSDLAVEAGRYALRSANEPRVDAVLLATTTPDHSCPATAPTVASRLGLNGLPAFDVAAVCSGFIYGLANATGLIAAGLAERVLLIAADTFSTIVDPTDRSTAVIFGDGAGAVVLRAGHTDEPGALLGFDLGSDGDNVRLVGVAAGGSRQRSTGPSTQQKDHYLAMEGRKLYRHAIDRMSASCAKALQTTGWAVSDVDLLVPHQANALIISGVVKALGLPAERGFSNIEHVGNTAVASVPIALAHAARMGVLKAGNRVLISAFGAGLSWGAATLTWPDVTPHHNFGPQLIGR